MDAFFGLLFLLYMVVSVMTAVTRGRQGTPRRAGAPWPRIPPVAAPGPGTEAAEAAEPLAGPPASEARGDTAAERGCAAETRPDAPPLAGPAAGHEASRRASAENDRGGMRRPSPEGWFSEEGLSLEWAEAGPWETDSGRVRPQTASQRRTTSPGDGRPGRPDAAAAPAGGSFIEIEGLRPEGIVRAMVLAEVLGPPLAHRRRIRL